MTKKIVASLLGVLFLLIPFQASAHILKTDNNIGAVIHIDPEDDPIVSKESNLFFEFKDKTGKFDARNCICSITINEGSTVLTEDQLTTDQKNKNAGSFTYVFPKKGVYNITITGRPVTQNAFQSFVLHYDVRVARTEEANTGKMQPSFLTTHIPHAVGAILILGFFIFALIKQHKNTKSK